MKFIKISQTQFKEPPKKKKVQNFSTLNKKIVKPHIAKKL